MTCIASVVIQNARPRRKHNTYPGNAVQSPGIGCFDEGARNYGTASEDGIDSAFDSAHVTYLVCSFSVGFIRVPVVIALS